MPFNVAGGVKEMPLDDVSSEEELPLNVAGGVEEMPFNAVLGVEVSPAALDGRVFTSVVLRRLEYDVGLDVPSGVILDSE